MLRQNPEILPGPLPDLELVERALRGERFLTCLTLLLTDNASRAMDGALQTRRSRRRSHIPAVEPWTPETISEAAGELLQAGLELFGAMQNAVSPEVLVIDEALAWEERRRAEEG